VIRNIKAYQQIRDAEYWRDLSRMSIDDSIRLGEDLLTSQIVDVRAFADDDHPMSLARSLGIAPARKVP
jgi:hypothetical protein